MAAFTTAKLLLSIGRRSFIPTNQLTFTTAEILDMADEEIADSIMSNILKAREEYFVTYKDYTITAGTASYNIPARAVGMILKSVYVIDSNGAVSVLPRIEPDEITSTAQGGITGFYLQNNQVVLNQVPSASGNTLRIPFFLQPGELVETSAAAVISAIDTVTKIVTVTSIPSTWITGDIFDFVKQDGGHEYVDIDYTSSNISSNNITFSALPSTLRVGDYISLAGESPLVQLPPNYRPVLAQAVAALMLESMNQPGADKAMKKLERMLKSAQDMITPRAQNTVRTITPDAWY